MKNILVCVCGGIAAYKVVSLVSLLRKSGRSIRVLMTDNAKELVAPLTFQSLSSYFVTSDTFDTRFTHAPKHELLSEWADLIVVAPATGNIIGKLRNGIGDDLVSSALLCTYPSSKLLVLPAMNTNMYLNPLVQKNIDILKGRGVIFMDPSFGKMSMESEAEGTGRLPEPINIFNFIENLNI